MRQTRENSHRGSQVMSISKLPRSDFDIAALFDALDEQRIARQLSWTGVAKEIRNQSATLSARLLDHPFSPSTLTGMPRRIHSSCQHALAVLRWLGRSPESFISGSTVDPARTALPLAGDDRRLRWDLQKLYKALDKQRRERHKTWIQLACELQCTANQLTGIRTARYAISMRLAMRVAQWLHRPARDFVYAAKW